MKRTEFSVVMPVGELEFLGYSLPSVFGLEPSEVILLFDGGANEVLREAKRFVGGGCDVKFVSVRECSWRFRPAFLRRLGFKLARNDVILNTDSDVVLDGGIKRFLGVVGEGKVAHLGFEVYDYPVSFRCCLKRLLEFFRVPTGWLSQVYLFSRKAWLDTEDVEEVKCLERGEDTHLHEAIRRKYRTGLVLSKSWHLRPVESGERHYLRGRLYWKVAKRSFLLAVLSGVLMFRFGLIKGYIHERWGK